MHNIVILGGNLAGVSTAHYLLRYALPSLNSAGEKGAYKVTLVSPSDHTFFNISAPRATISSDVLHKMFASIPDAFSQYNTSEFTFIQGEAVDIQESAKTVSVRVNGDITSVPYGSLVIATGARAATPLWSLHGDYKNTIAAFEELQATLSKAASVLIVGGGPAGVETAGEIASQYKSLKTISLFSGTSQLLTNLKNPAVGRAAEQQLRSLGVAVVHKLRVTASTKLASGQTSVKFSDGTEKVVDLYIDCTGRAPNSGFVPDAWKDGRGRVAVDATTLRATQAPAGVYSIGDVASFSRGNILDAGWAAPALGYSIWADLRPGNLPVMLKERKYKQLQADMQFVPIGPKGGVGVLFGWRIPSFLIWLVKSRTFFIEKAAGWATGAEVKA